LTTAQGLYNSGADVDIPVISELSETYTTYTILLDHFNSTAFDLFIGSEAQSVGPSSTIPLRMAHSTMVPHTMIIPAQIMVASQAPIGTPLSSRTI
jgi:hypothetical protein